ncbi:MAG: glycosyltransferase family 2 protein [Spirochaetaceae bacterium]
MNVSVVIPAHNAESSLPRAIRSALAQDTPASSIVVVDDASTDRTAAVAEEFEDPRLTVVRRRSAGPGGYAARNAGVASTVSQWIAFLDADDEWLPGHLSALERLHRTFPGVPFLSTGWRTIYPDGSSTVNKYSTRFDHPAEHALSLRRFLWVWSSGTAPAWTSAVCVARTAIDQAGGFPAGRCTRGGDVDTWLRVMLAAREMAYTSRATAVYHRDIEQSVTRRKQPQVDHCTSLSVRRALAGERSLSVRFLLKRLGNHHKKDPIRKKARREGLSAADLGGLYPLASPLFFLLAAGLALMPRCLLDLALTLRDRAVRLRVR